MTNLPPPVPAPSRPLHNPFLQKGRWYKAALHVHTTTSDGDVDVETRIRQYREAGYDVIAITDHWKTNDLALFADAGSLLLTGMEIHPETKTGAPAHHLVCLGLPHPFSLNKELPSGEMLQKVQEAGAIFFYAHPYWTAHGWRELTELSGYFALEVYNAVCDIEADKGFSEVHWDQLLNDGRILPALVTDDVHRSGELNRGWTMIRAESLDPASILEALTNGCFYGSCGPVIDDFRQEGSEIRLTCSPAAKVGFYFDGVSGGRCVLPASDGLLCSASWSFATRKELPRWVRAEVTDANGKKAWTNPLPIMGKSD